MEKWEWYAWAVRRNAQKNFTPKSLKCWIMSAGKYLIAALLIVGCGRVNTSTKDSGWATFGHDASNNKFSALTSIDTSNVSQLHEAWRVEDTTSGAGLYFNPVMIGNKLIALMPSSALVAMDPATGKTLWEFKPDTSSISNWSKGISGLPRRGDEPDKLFFIYGSTLYGINAETGQPIQGFGKNGRVDFYEGLEVPDSMRNAVPVSSNAPGVVYNDLFIVGCKVPDELPSISGDIRAFNIHTGK